MQESYGSAQNDGEVNSYTRRTSALEWLTNRTFGASSVVFLTVLILWTVVLLTGFSFFLRDVVVGHGIDAAFSSFGLIISFIYAEFYKRWRTHKRDSVDKYFRAREELKSALFFATRDRHITLDDALLYHLALYQAYNRHYVARVYTAYMEPLYRGKNKSRIEAVLDNHNSFLSDFILHQPDHPPEARALYTHLSKHVTNAKVSREVPVPSIYNVHTYFLFFFALFILYPFATWVAVGSVLATFAVPFVLFMLFVPFVVDSVIGDPWNPDRMVDIGSHETWFRFDVEEYIIHLGEKGELQKRKDRKFD